MSTLLYITALVILGFLLLFVGKMLIYPPIRAKMNQIMLKYVKKRIEQKDSVTAKYINQITEAILADLTRQDILGGIIGTVDLRALMPDTFKSIEKVRKKNPEAFLAILVRFGPTLLKVKQGYRNMEGQAVSAIDAGIGQATQQIAQQVVKK